MRAGQHGDEVAASRRRRARQGHSKQKVQGSVDKSSESTGDSDSSSDPPQKTTEESESDEEQKTKGAKGRKRKQGTRHGNKSRARDMDTGAMESTDAWSSADLSEESDGEEYL